MEVGIENEEEERMVHRKEERIKQKGEKRKEGTRDKGENEGLESRER